MPKAIKGNAGRKPPEPAASHSDIEEWTQRQMPHLQPIVKVLDQTIRAEILGLQYAVKWKRPYYGLPELGWIIEIAAYDVSVNVVFFGGADFDRSPPRGTTDRTRYVKVTSWKMRSDRSSRTGSSRRAARQVGVERTRQSDESCVHLGRSGGQPASGRSLYQQARAQALWRRRT